MATPDQLTREQLADEIEMVAEQRDGIAEKATALEAEVERLRPIVEALAALFCGGGECICALRERARDALAPNEGQP